MRNLALILTFMSFSLLAAPEEISFKNDREGVSSYHHVANLKALTATSRQLGEEKLIEAYHVTKNSFKENELCAFDFNKTLMAEVQKIDPSFNDLNGMIQFLRNKEEIDDVAAKILLDADELVHKKISRNKLANIFFITSKKELYNAQLGVIASFRLNFLYKSCLDDAYKGFYNELIKLDKKMNRAQLKAMLIESYRLGHISDDIFILLSQARKAKLETKQLTLKSYYQKFKSLRTQYPLRDTSERSRFVTEVIKKEKSTRRQKLFERYSDLQIILMANVIKKLRVRIESPRIDIAIYDKTQKLDETISLEPMERFRFAIKILRKEMRHLALNSYFQGRSPDYIDIITAAYEVGLVPASELDQIAGLQEIWDPKKSFWDKAGLWIKSFAGIASIAIPAPYGFIPTLAIVVIEAVFIKKDKPKDESASLF